jgi:predicted nucleotidyltransferase
LDRVTAVLANHPEILFSYVHGSFLQPRAFRDMDLVVYLAEPLPLSRFRYEDALERELSKALALDFPVDVRIANHTPLPFQHHAYQGQLLVDRDPERRAAVLTHVASRYLDLKPILEHHTREAFGDDPRP